MKKKRLNIGCGNDLLEGYDNCDAKPENDRIKKADVVILENIRTNYYDEVLMKMILEHVHIDLIPTALFQAHRVLKPGGKLEIISPDFDALVDRYLKIRGKLNNTKNFFLFKDIVYNLLDPEIREGAKTHQSVITKDFLKMSLEAEGFIIRKIGKYQNEEMILYCVAQKYGDYSIMQI